MGALRRERAKKETFFLDMVSGQLANMNEEINDLKQLVRTLLSFHVPLQNDESDDSLFWIPPPAPPPLDSYSRDFLLRCRRYEDAVDPMDSSLPRTMAHSVLNDCCRASQAQFEPTTQSFLDDDITSFLRSEGHFDDQDIEAKIVAAQRNAFAKRTKENKAIGVIQGFWKTCKSRWLLAKSRRYGRPETESNNDGAEVSRNLDHYFEQLNESLREPGFAEAFAESLVSPDKQVSYEDIENAQLHGDVVIHRYMKHRVPHLRNRQSSADKLESLDKRMQTYISETLGMLHAVPETKQNAFIYKAIRGLSKRNNIPPDVFQSAIDYLEIRLGVRSYEALPFLCQNCSEAFECMPRACSECGSHDVFDSRCWITSNSNSDVSESGDDYDVP